MVSPRSRLGEAEKQTRLAHDHYCERDIELPDGLRDEIGEIAERLRRATHAIDEQEEAEG